MRCVCFSRADGSETGDKTLGFPKQIEDFFASRREKMQQPRLRAAHWRDDCSRAAMLPAPCARQAVFNRVAPERGGKTSSNELKL